MKKSIYILASAITILFTNPIFAQLEDPGEDIDTPAPIGDYVWVLALIGLVFVFMKLRTAMLPGSSSK
jgi:hypothetical protein